jgi:hypothetical protein
MEPKFQTSFIPKQSLAAATPSVAPHRRGRQAFGIGTVVSVTLFIIVVSASALLFLYQHYLQSAIASNQDSLSRARDAFEPALITELERLDQRINGAEQVLNQHIAPSSLFALLSSIALQNVQFTDYTYTAGSAGSALIHIELSGKTDSFKTLALQSDLVRTDQSLKNASISGVGLDTTSGDVVFRLSADVDPRLINYDAQVQQAAASAGTDTTGSSVAPASANDAAASSTSI